MAKNHRDTAHRIPKNRRIHTHIKDRRTGFVRSSSGNITDPGGSIGNSIDLGISERMAAGIMGTDHGKSSRNIVAGIVGKRRSVVNETGIYGRFNGYFSALYKNNTGDAVVEATILFPIMIMIFAALVLLSMYLPAQAVLQRATQYAATAIATENSDTWLYFDESSMKYDRETDKRRLKNVYADLFMGSGDIRSKGEAIVHEIESRGISSRAGHLNVDCYFVNRILYKEVVVTAVREIPMPVDLSFVGFPRNITITATSAAAVHDGDEFVRSIGIANDFAGFISDRYGLYNITDAISSFGSRVTGLLGW